MLDIFGMLKKLFSLEYQLDNNNKIVSVSKHFESIRTLSKSLNNFFTTYPVLGKKREKIVINKLRSVNSNEKHTDMTINKVISQFFFYVKHSVIAATTSNIKHLVPHVKHIFSTHLISEHKPCIELNRHASITCSDLYESRGVHNFPGYNGVI